MLDFNLDYDTPPTEFNAGSAIGTIQLDVENDTPSSALKSTTSEYDVVSVRAVIHTPCNRAFLCQVNNRVNFGSMTAVLPGGIVEGKSVINALREYMRDQVGISKELNPSNCRFIQSRVFETTNDSGHKSKARIDFYAINSEGSVPYNLCPDSVVSLSWLSLEDIERYVATDSASWKVQAGAMDAIIAVLDPEKSRTKDGVREVSRQDGGTPSGSKTISYASQPLEYSKKN